MTDIDTAREWARVARDKHEHYERNVAPNWPTNPTAVSVHEQNLAKTVPHLVEQIETLLTELDRRQAVVDAAEQVIAAGRLSMDTPGVDVETIQHSALARLVEAVEALEALNGEGTVQPLTAEPDSNVTVVYDRVGAAWSRDENGSWRMRGEGVPWRFHNLAREFGPITMRPAR